MTNHEKDGNRRQRQAREDEVSDLRGLLATTKPERRKRCPWCWRRPTWSQRSGFAIHKDKTQGTMCYGSGRQP